MSSNEATETRSERDWPPFVLATLMLAGGGYLLLNGGMLAALGGSPYYVLAGAALLVSGVLLALRRFEGILVYALLFVATVAWSFWEVGLDGWQLLPRLAALTVLGGWLLLPRTRRKLHRGRSNRLAALGGGALAVAIPVAVVLGLALHTLRPERVDPILQTGMAPPSRLQPASADDGLAELPADAGEWRYYGRDAGGQRFTPLRQITSKNVRDLQLAWIYRTGPSPQGKRSTLESVPLIIGDTVYVCTSVNEVIALDSLSGKQRWRYDPGVDWQGSGRAVCRGVTYYRTPDASGECAERIMTATIDAQLIAVDAHTGQPCSGFGDRGRVSLLRGMGNVPKGYYYVSSPPTIVRGRAVVGGWVADGQYWGEPSGVIRAFDAVTGEFAWAFDVGRLDRQSEPPPGEQYTPATPNSWSVMSGDEELGLVYAPMGNATPDYYGAQRRWFDDAFSSGVVAIEADTGKLRWSFQTAHHDLWDYDVASQPVLVDLPHEGELRKALLQPTKRGEIFVLDRVTGQPIHAVEERPAPQAGAAEGERLAPTQPYPTGLPSFRGRDIIESDMWGATPLDQLWCRLKFRRARYDGPLTPPGVTSYIQFPGYLGGMNWGSVSVNPEQLLMTVNVNHVATYNRLLPRAEADRLGLKPIEDASTDVGGAVAQTHTPFAALIGPFLSPLEMPCQAPPYGVLSAVDLRTGQLLWTQPFGTAKANGPLGIPSMLPFTLGTPNLGGALNTASGLTFIAATTDSMLRAYAAVSGKLLWEAKLPAGGQSTPVSYLARDGRQFVAISAGGMTGFGAKHGDYIVAFAVPTR
jgi:quinoprotein glucose dehydrogenase